jgi:hypothetical protein
LKNSNTIMVVAGGWSVSQLKNRDKLIDDACVIGVNDSCLRMPCDYGVTMDRKWLENRFEELKRNGVQTYFRKCTARNVAPQLPQFVPYWGNVDRGQMTEEQGQLWGDNSGKVALNLAFQLKPKRIFMLGFDMKAGPEGDMHWYKPYEWGHGSGAKKLAGWALTYDYIIDQFAAHDIELRQVGRGAIPPHKIKTISIEKFDAGAWKK